MPCPAFTERSLSLIVFPSLTFSYLPRPPCTSLPYLALRLLASRYLVLHCLPLTYSFFFLFFVLPFPTLPCSTLPFTLQCLAFLFLPPPYPSFTLPSLPYLSFPCNTFTVPFLALPYPTLPFLAQNLEPTVAFFTADMSGGLEEIKAAVMSCPSILSRSLDKRIMPRAQQMRDKEIEPRFGPHKWVVSTYTDAQFNRWLDGRGT